MTSAAYVLLTTLVGILCLYYYDDKDDYDICPLSCEFFCNALVLLTTLVGILSWCCESWCCECKDREANDDSNDGSNDAYNDDDDDSNDGDDDASNDGT